ncbi:uracil phosphoribosyltransferase-domain-containing protein [Aspergillus keveii]|uniref:Uracil phosphoribosyltransferase-domain-containing protein n=1 Tax=Aspergillus keveii TaxID=714993 RepID=A0ABR4FGY3_9EURO
MEPKLAQSANSAGTANGIIGSSSPIIGLYGISGSGKSYLLKQLMEELGQDAFEYYEGSDMIHSVTPGGLDSFHRLREDEKAKLRRHAIDKIKSECAQSKKTGIVAGHFMLWAEEEETGTRVYTQNDLAVFTHILYVNTPAEVMFQRRQEDAQKYRPAWSIQHLHRWQQTEIKELRELCRAHNILFSTIYPNFVSQLPELILDFQRHTEDYNVSIAEHYLDKALSHEYETLETVILMDADRTLTASDTGAIFWTKVTQPEGDRNPFQVLFGSQLGYSYTAFRQAMLLCEEETADPEYDAICEDVVSQTTLYPEFVRLLRLVGKYSHVRPIIVTCGLRRVWEKVLHREGFSSTVKILGGGRLKDGFVVTPSVKKAMVDRVRSFHSAYTWAIGDSPLDLPMMTAADQAVVVVGEQGHRSKSMDGRLLAAVEQGLQARQALLPGDCPVRLDTSQLPVIDFGEEKTITEVLQHRIPPGRLQLVHATDSNAAKLLMTPMRDASVKGPAQRKAHSSAGKFLALAFLSDNIGLEETRIDHVQDRQTAGFRLRGEKRTLIVALMRAGEPMAQGVNKVFPEAGFLHANQVEDIEQRHIDHSDTIILVDSVINSGKTMVPFIQRVRRLHSAVRIVVVAGVIQEQAVQGCSPLRALARSFDLAIVALRISQNKYTGARETDTGNRLFGTTYLD